MSHPLIPLLALAAVAALIWLILWADPIIGAWFAEREYRRRAPERRERVDRFLERETAGDPRATVFHGSHGAGWRGQRHRNNAPGHNANGLFR